MVNPLYVAFDLAIVALSFRSFGFVRGRAPLTAWGWILTAGYGAAAAIEFAVPALHAAGAAVAGICLLLLAGFFILAGIRDEPQAEPFLWPRRLGQTRAERRR